MALFQSRRFPCLYWQGSRPSVRQNISWSCHGISAPGLWSHRRYIPVLCPMGLSVQIQGRDRSEDLRTSACPSRVPFGLIWRIFAWRAGLPCFFPWKLVRSSWQPRYFCIDSKLLRMLWMPHDAACDPDCTDSCFHKARMTEGMFCRRLQNPGTTCRLPGMSYRFLQTKKESVRLNLARFRLRCSSDAFWCAWILWWRHQDQDACLKRHQAFRYRCPWSELCILQARHCSRLQAGQEFLKAGCSADPSYRSTVAKSRNDQADPCELPSCPDLPMRQ